MLNRRTLLALGLLLVTAFGTAPAVAQNCNGGVTFGQINLPNTAGIAGSIQGQLIIGHTGPTIYAFQGTLTELPPTAVGNRRGIIDGMLFDSAATPKFLVRGRWFADARGNGFFRCIIFTLTTVPQRVGRIGGQFPASVGPNAPASYLGNWVVCQ